MHVWQGGHTQSACYLVGLGGDEESGAIMLGAEFVVELVFDLGEVSVGLAGDNYCLCLVPGGVGLDKVFQGIVVNVICTIGKLSATGASIRSQGKDETVCR